jgi:hypothetical protein
MTESLGPLRSKKQHSTSLDIESLGAFTRPDKALPALDTPRQKREPICETCAESYSHHAFHGARRAAGSTPDQEAVSTDNSTRTDTTYLVVVAAPAVKAWKCQLALAITQISFCCGSVYLKRALRAVDSTKGQNFHPIIYAFTREVIAAPIMCSMAWASSRKCKAHGGCSNNNHAQCTSVLQAHGQHLQVGHLESALHDKSCCLQVYFQNVAICYMSVLWASVSFSTS